MTHTPVYLVLLGFGYWLFRTAENETKKNVKYVGRMVSAVVLLVSLFGLLCPVLFECGARRAPAAAMCAYGGMGGRKASSGCPFMGSSTIAPAAPAAEEKPADKK